MPGADAAKPFAVNLDDDGLFKSMVLPDAPKREQNIMKAWAAMLQVNRKKIMAGEKAFVSEEVRYHLHSKKQPTNWQFFKPRNLLI